MRNRALLIAAPLLLAPLLVSGSGQAQAGIVAIVNSHNDDVQSVSAGTLQSIFLGRTKFWSAGQPIRAYARSPDTEAGRELLRVLRMAPARYRHYWQERQFSGQGTAPRELRTASDAAAYVAASRGGISIVTAVEARRLGDRVRAVPIR